MPLPCYSCKRLEGRQDLARVECASLRYSQEYQLGKLRAESRVAHWRQRPGTRLVCGSRY